MPTKYIPKIVLFSITLILSVYVGFNLNKSIAPQLDVLPQIDKQQAMERARSVMREHGLNPNDFMEFGFFRVVKESANYLLSSEGKESFTQIVDKDSLDISYWHVEYFKNESRGTEEHYVKVEVSPKGKILTFFQKLPSKIKMPFITEKEAADILNAYMARSKHFSIAGFELEQVSHKKTETRSNTFFVYKKQVVNKDSKIEIEAHLAGDKVISVQSYFKETAEDDAKNLGGANILFNAVSIIVYLGVSLLSIIFFLKYYHRGLVSVKQAAWFGLFFYVINILYLVNIWDVWGVGTNFGLIGRLYTKFILLGVQSAISFPFLMFTAIASWANGDYELANKRQKILAGIDSLLNKKIFSRNVGKELPIGITYGAIIFALLALTDYTLIHLADAQPLLIETNSLFYAISPLFSLFYSIIAFIFVQELLFRKFLIPFLQNRNISAFLSVVISAAAFSLYNIFFTSGHAFWPAYYTLIPFFIIGLVQGFIFLRYGLLASISAGSFYLVLSHIMLMNASAVDYQTEIGIIVTAVVIVLGIGLWGLFKGEAFVYAPVLEPEHIRRIKEQTRLQKEIEIATRVQLGLLPRKQPKLKGFDIAGACYPALEVGGDYFDFITLKDKRLGIAIADVSGKGVPAAIYMTLTKGILQSNAEAGLSPGQVLEKVNSLMYRSIERSWFVSMFYAIMDPEKGELHYARAGHNPAIVLHGDKEPTLLQPNGIGLGLEKGPIFSKTLQEGVIKLNKKDTLVLYTDGFTEAMNENNDEYGDDPFFKFLDKNKALPAQKILDASVYEMKQFANGSQQHDDMTMIVLKVS